MFRNVWLVTAGAAAGAIAGLLLAPRPGKQSRALIRERSVKIGRDLASLARAKGQVVSTKVAGYRHRFGKALGGGSASETAAETHA